MNMILQRTKRKEAPYLNRVVGNILSTGMYTTILLYLLGLILAFMKVQNVPPMSMQYFHSLNGFLYALARFDPSAFLYLGTLSLILTPVCRVLVSIFAFLRQRDFRFTGVTAAVFLIMLASVLVGSVFKLNLG